MPKIFIAGNSHTAAIKKAIEHLGAEALEDFDITVVWLKMDKSKFGDVSLEDAMVDIKKLSPDDIVVISLLGSTHNVLGLVNHPEPFTFVNCNPGENDPTLIPVNLMRDFLAKRTHSETVLASIRDATDARVFHLMPPPPKRDLSQVKVSPKADGKRDIHTYGFAPADSRLSFWQIEADMTGNYVTSLGVEPLTSPAGTCDSDGFLAEEFYAGDATHANAAYGVKVLEELMKLAAARLPRETPLPRS